MHADKDFWTEERINHAMLAYAALMYGHARLVACEMTSIDRWMHVSSMLAGISSYVEQDRKSWRNQHGQKETQTGQAEKA